MQKHTQDTVVYEIENSLYINLTNKCPLSCVFCIRKNKCFMGHSLWLKNEPDAREVIESLEKHFLNSKKSDILIKEAVFCGYGEPTYKMRELKAAASYIKENKVASRLNTNGLGNYINGRDITVELKGLIDAVSVSLNAPDRQGYNKLTRASIDGAFEHMLEFTRACIQRGIRTVLTAVDILEDADLERCRLIAQGLGAEFRVRRAVSVECKV